MKRRVFLAGVLATASVPLAGCGVLSTNENEGDIHMGSNSFRPETYREATVGEPVVWANNSTHSHTVTAYGDRLPEEGAFFASGGFENERAARNAWRSNSPMSEGSGAIESGESYSHTFEVAGTFTYFCVPHETAGMVGTVVVNE